MTRMRQRRASTRVRLERWDVGRMFVLRVDVSSWGLALCDVHNLELRVYACSEGEGDVRATLAVSEAVCEDCESIYLDAWVLEHVPGPVVAMLEVVGPWVADAEVTHV